MTKLYDVPNNSIIKLHTDLDTPPGAPKLHKNEILKFYHIDGMYSYCKTMDNVVCHLAAYADVAVIGKFIDENHK